MDKMFCKLFYIEVNKLYIRLRLTLTTKKIEFIELRKQ
jgi:hypothetical protein